MRAHGSAPAPRRALLPSQDSPAFAPPTHHPHWWAPPEYDKDNIPPAVVAAIRPYLERPELNPESVRKASKAAYGLMEWVRAMEAYDRWRHRRWGGVGAGADGWRLGKVQVWHTMHGPPNRLHHLWKASSCTSSPLAKRPPLGYGTPGWPRWLHLKRWRWPRQRRSTAC